ncbi:hypothetical protein [Xanthomonas phaseoli]|nr:hypothetical protein XANMN_08595 [Xanthomonas phaseoli pv. manihotis str. CIO151]
MSKLCLALVGLMSVCLASCSGGGPAETEREHAFLQFVKANSNEEARIVTSTFNLTHRGNFKLTRLP